MDRKQAIDLEYKLHDKYVDVLAKYDCGIMIDHTKGTGVLLSSSGNVIKEMPIDNFLKYLEDEQKKIKPFPLNLTPPAWKLKQIVSICKQSILLVKQNREYFSDDFDYDMIQNYENILNLLK